MKPYIIPWAPSEGASKIISVLFFKNMSHVSIANFALEELGILIYSKSGKGTDYLVEFKDEKSHFLFLMTYSEFL